jgi:hypothetical protein
MSKCKVTLGGANYTIEPLPIAKSKQWRKKLAGPFHAITDALERAGAIELVSDVAKAGDGESEGNSIGAIVQTLNLGSIGSLVQTLSGTLLDSIDIVLDLLFAYAPALQRDRDRIEATATDEEALQAFIVVLRMAYPFESLVSGLRGPAKPLTSKK